MRLAGAAFQMNSLPGAGSDCRPSGRDEILLIRFPFDNPLVRFLTDEQKLIPTGPATSGGASQE
jgi:hypothetical protein